MKIVQACHPVRLASGCADLAAERERVRESLWVRRGDTAELDTTALSQTLNTKGQ